MKLKTLASLTATGMALGWQVEGQTNIAPIVTTNWVTAVPYYREVNGQLYNTQKSVKFQFFSGQVERVLPNAIVLQQVSKMPVHGTPESDSLSSDGNFLGSSGGPAVAPITGWKTVYGPKIFITNFPDELQPATGDNESGKAMRKGTVNFNGDVLQLWDYGTPHVVAVVTTNYSRAFKTAN